MPQQGFEAEAVDDGLEALRAEVAALQDERDRTFSNRALVVSYHTFASRARDCASLVRYCVDALESAWGDSCTGRWAWIEQGIALESGFLLGGEEPQTAAELYEVAKRDRKTFLVREDVGKELCIVPIFGLVPRASVIGIIVLEVNPNAALDAHQLGAGDVIGLLAGMHVDRLARTDAQRLEVTFAAAAAKAQRLLAEPRERPDALRLATKALSEADLDVAAVVERDSDGGLELIDSAGNFEAGEAIEFARQAIDEDCLIWTDQKRLALSLGSGRGKGVLMVRNPAPIGSLNEDIMGGVASAMNASVARHAIAQELEDLRRSTTRQLIDAQERERAIVAGEIHDGVIQQLSAVAMRLELGHLHAQRGEAQSALVVVKAEAAKVRESTRELRKLLVDLRPQVIDDHGLEPALLELTSRFESADVKLLVELAREPDGEVAIAIYRLVQEALTNVHKHARAERVHVSVVEHDEQLVIEIEDDGIGLVVAAPGPTATGRHYGVLGMRERARMLGGEFTIGAGTNKGTIVRVTLPRS